MFPPRPLRHGSREKKFFARLEEDFDLELVGSPNVERSVTEEILSGVAGVDLDRGVYLLLGARRRRRHAKEGSSPLNEWRHNGRSQNRVPKAMSGVECPGESF